MESKTFPVTGLTCSDCADRLRTAVGSVDGVSDTEIDLGTGTLTVSFFVPDLPAEEIARVIQAEGFGLGGERNRDPAPLGFLRFALSRTDTRLALVAGLLTLLSLALSLVRVSPLVRTAGLATAIAVGGVPLARNAIRDLWRSRRLGIDGLMVIAVTGAVFIGEWAEAAVVVVLFSLGEALEGYAADRARSAVESLLDLAPPVALQVLPGGGLEETPVELLAVGDRVLARSGDRIAVDGLVLSGQSAVDQSAITGESLPVEKEPGDKVFAGTVNTTASIEIEVTRISSDSTLSRMVALVSEARSRQPPVQRFIDRFAQVYTPAVAVLAALVAVVPSLFFGQPFLGEQGWLMRALQMLVIACPCALVISTPVSLVSAMTNAAARGVLVKGGRVLEALSRVGAFAFDKTGTLTEGRPVVTDVVDVCGCGECVQNCGLKHAAALELQSSHPLALALLDEAQVRQVDVPSAEDVTVLGGRGVRGTVKGSQVTVGSHAHFDSHVPHPESVCFLAQELAAQAKTVILVEHDNEVCSVFGVADVPRASSLEVVSDLRDAGFHTVMLSGDDRAVAEEIGRQIGLDEVKGELLPQEKMEAISTLARKYGAVAMVGDGVNDAPALAQADVGIAMGGAGSDQAMETADVVLMADDLSQLPFVVRLSRRTKRTISFNIGFSLVVKAVIFALAGAGLATLWMAVAADVGASLLVVLNGMRLRRAAS